ncbi:MAG: enolase C-terminal domain-like protein, partial [Bacteroidota bacterium]
IRMDANGGWNLEQARRQIEAGLALGVNSFEQPLAAQATKDSQKLVEEYGADARIMADEALCTFADAKHLIDFQACNHFSLKLSKNGGLFNTLRIYQLAQKNGIACQLSAHYGETSILSSAGLLFASIADQLTACEGALGTFLLSEDITKTPVMVNRQGRINGTDLSFMGWPVPVNDDSLKRNSVHMELGV